VTGSSHLGSGIFVWVAAVGASQFLPASTTALGNDTEPFFPGQMKRKVLYLEE